MPGCTRYTKVNITTYLKKRSSMSLREIYQMETHFSRCGQCFSRMSDLDVDILVPTNKEGLWSKILAVLHIREESR